MRVNTGRFLSMYDLKDLTRAYTNAYLHQKGLLIDDADEPQIDRKHNLGAFGEDGYLIKAADNSMFTLYTANALADAEQVTQSQVLSCKLHDGFLDVITFFIANNYKKLPSNKLKIGFCLDHDNDYHWTMLMANFEGLNQAQYGALYRAYQAYVRVHPVASPRPGAESSVTQMQLHHVKNFLIRHKDITLNTHNSEGELVRGNLALPINAKKITLSHYDSMGDSYHEVVEDAARDFIEQHRATFKTSECEEQSGCTCGDWSVYNAMRFGLLNHGRKDKPPYPSTKFSKTLRALSQNITQDNAAQILFAKKPDIQEALDDEKICVTQYGRTEMARWDEDDRRERRRIRERLRQRIRENRENAENNRHFNNPYPLLNLLSRLALGILVATSLFWVLSAFFTINAGFALFLAMIGCVTSSCYLYDLTSAYLFGKEIVLVDLNDKHIPHMEDLSEQEGLINYLGIKAPYHKPLQVLESEISALLADNHGDKQERSLRQTAQQAKHKQILTHFYAQKIVKANPHCFYEADRAIASKKSYADKKKAKSILRANA